MTPSLVAPLSLSTTKIRYPRLFRQYAFLSDREKESTADIIDSDPVVDDATGLCTTISFTDFTKPLEDNGDCPMTSESDANKYCIFLWKVLIACETGSICGDACRQFEVLNCALEDALTMQSVAAKFEHLLGWTAAATNHGLHALLYRGDPDRNRSLFKSVGDEWKKVYDKTANNAVMGVSEACRTFAIWMCESFRTLLKEAKAEYGDYAKYTFNFMKKPRAPKASVAAAKSRAVAAAAAAKSRVVAAAAVAASSTVNGGGTSQRSFTVVVNKPSKSVKLGLGIAQEKGTTTIKVTSIHPSSLFVGTALKVDMILQTINGIKYGSFTEGSALLKTAIGQITIVAAFPGLRGPPAATNNAPAASSTNGGNYHNEISMPATTNNAPAASSTIGGSNQRENSVSAKNSSSKSDDEPKPWTSEDFVPMSEGKQKNPTMVRNELQNYIDQCKVDGTMNQTRITEKMGVSIIAFCRFMNPNTYTDEWSATQNGTYLAAARLLAEVQYENVNAKKNGAKRKMPSSDEDSTKKPKAGNSRNTEVMEFLNRINAVEGVPNNLVYDTCPQLVTKIRVFLQRTTMNKAILLKALGGINGNSLNRFLAGNGQDQCGNVTYKAAYVFFEKERILGGQEKTDARLKNEQEHPNGFSLAKNKGGSWISPNEN